MKWQKNKIKFDNIVESQYYNIRHQQYHNIVGVFFYKRCYINNNLLNIVMLQYPDITILLYHNIVI